MAGPLRTGGHSGGRTDQRGGGDQRPGRRGRPAPPAPPARPPVGVDLSHQLTRDPSSVPAAGRFPTASPAAERGGQDGRDWSDDRHSPSATPLAESRTIPHPPRRRTRTTARCCCRWHTVGGRTRTPVVSVDHRIPGRFRAVRPRWTALPHPSADELRRQLDRGDVDGLRAPAPAGAAGGPGHVELRQAGDPGQPAAGGVVAGAAPRSPTDHDRPPADPVGGADVRAGRAGLVRRGTLARPAVWRPAAPTPPCSPPPPWSA